ncbi:enoyl-CoA hydratase-related protein [Nocardia wallacei]|uniref:enoyl-CoA hydratase-related protein n=1 Tax=Nocardia wallacei TaxID=480035 RepID=UPI00245682BF|nr:enoyl-CoA hydratase-related protein [Nocardia wallacei]
MTTRKTSTVTVTEHPRHWATLRIDNPPLNLLDDRVYGELAVALERFESDPEIHVVVLESADPEFFRRTSMFPSHRNKPAGSVRHW